MEQNEKIITGCCLATAVLAFLPWYSVSISGAEGVEELFRGAGMSVSGWGMAAGVLAVVAALAAVGLIHAGRSDMLPWSRRAVLIAPFLACAVSCVCMLLFTGGGPANTGMFGTSVSAGRTFWFWLAFVAMGAATWLAFQRWQQGVAAERESERAGVP